ncbi:hypothetical protein KAR91_51425 [Candidatus Pacearchaeota archaeon]|nr:hypothetical protein [Candidatus Pacearchaeota archaeon]
MWASFDYFEIKMTKKQAESASHSGNCLDDVIALLKLPMIKRQVARISDEKLAAELSEHGAWSEDELANRNYNEERIVWIAACNIVEDVDNAKAEQEDKANRRKEAVKQ